MTASTTIDPNVTTEILARAGLSLSQAARRFPPYRGSASVNPSTVWRWIHEGVRLPDGTRLRLEAVRLGGRWLTSTQAIERFITRQTPVLSDTAPTPTTRTARQHQKAAERAGKDLEKVGV